MNQFKEGTKMLLAVLAVLACSLGSLYFISFSDSPVVTVFFGAVVFTIFFGAVVLAVFVVFFVAVVFAVFVVFFVAVVFAFAGEFYLSFGFLCAVASIAVIIYATWDKGKRDIDPNQAVILLLILLLPMVFFCHLSHYNNANLVERDKAIAAGMRMEKREEEVVMILPSDLNGSNRYLSKVLTLRYCGEETTWKKLAERCQKGALVWHEAILRIQDKATTGTAPAAVALRFKHPWKKDYNTTITLAQ